MVQKSKKLIPILVESLSAFFRTLAHAAVQRVLNGETSLEEAARVVDLTNYGAENPDRITGTVDATV